VFSGICSDRKRWIFGMPNSCTVIENPDVVHCFHFSDTASVCSSDMSEVSVDDFSESFIEKEIMNDLAVNDTPEWTSEPESPGNEWEGPGKDFKGVQINNSEKTSDHFDVDMDKLELDSALMPPPWDCAPCGIQGPRPTAASLGLKESIEECLKVPENTEEDDEGGELDLTDIDDEEIDQVR
jgi:hypothetical protein